MNTYKKGLPILPQRVAIRLIAALALSGIAMPALADLRVNASRVVHVEGSGPARVRIQNTGERAALIQTWIDAGDSAASPEHQRAPLITTPPLFRLDSGKRTDIHVRAADTASLPRDRESLLWLNILDIPTRKAGQEKSAFEFAAHWRLKVFHRPVGLPGSQEASAAAVQWDVVEDEDGSLSLRARNPSAYYVSLRELEMAGQVLPVAAHHAQIPPYGTWTQRIPGGVRASNGQLPLQVKWLDGQGFVHALSTSVLIGERSVPSNDGAGDTHSFQSNAPR
ncbi:TPA: fimbria/pilus periplasmic chaperone [Stenotrophomonas maltophilia]|nr:fimbria/pilus periplasmic chaperone [Stenotrophomonas maltophilia]